MPERDVIVRCPGCGNGKVVTLALGQVLQCDICHTAFRAPVADDIDPVAAKNALAGAPPAESEALPSDVRPTSSSAGEPLPASPTPDASVAPMTRRAANPTLPSDSDEELDVERAPGMIWTIVAMLAVGVILALVVVAAFFIVRNFPRSTRNRSMTAQSQQDNQSDVVVHWTDASKSAQRRNPMTLKVERVVYGSLRAKDLSRQVITTADDNLLGITISARNQGRRVRAFQSWYRHVFEADNGQEVIAELFDDQNRDYSLLTFDDVSSIEGQRLADEIGPQQSVQDTVVFLIPQEVDRAAIKYFRLVLPGAAVGMSDFFRFEIPRSMIVGFDDQTAQEPLESDETR